MVLPHSPPAPLSATAGAQRIGGAALAYGARGCLRSSQPCSLSPQQQELSPRTALNPGNCPLTSPRAPPAIGSFYGDIARKQGWCPPWCRWHVRAQGRCCCGSQVLASIPAPAAFTLHPGVSPGPSTCPHVVQEREDELGRMRPVPTAGCPRHGCSSSGATPCPDPTAPSSSCSICTRSRCDPRVKAAEPSVASTRLRALTEPPDFSLLH